MSNLHRIPKTTLSDDDIADHNLPELCDALLTMRAMVSVLAADMIKVEAELSRRLGEPPLHCQKTHSVPGYAKVVLVNEAETKFDWARWNEIRLTVPEQWRPTRWIEVIDKSKLRYLRSADPVNLALVSPALLVTPKRVTVQIEQLNAAPEAQRRA